jgi:hypothetical protein
MLNVEVKGIKEYSCLFRVLLYLLSALGFGLSAFGFRLSAFGFRLWAFGLPLTADIPTSNAYS